MYHYYGITFVNQKNSLMHYGIQGMKWGIRRFQNEDGSLTEEGKKRYGQTSDELHQNLKRAEKEASEARSKYAQKKAKLFTTDIAIRRAEKKWGKAEKKLSEIRKVAEEYDKHNFNKQDLNDIKQDLDFAKEESKKARDAFMKNPKNQKLIKAMSDAFDKVHMLEDEYETKRTGKTKEQREEEHRQQIRSELQSDLEMPNGKKRDEALTEFLKRGAADQLSPEREALEDLMFEKSGDPMGDDSVTEGHRRAKEESVNAGERYSEASKKITERAKKEYKFDYNKFLKRQKELARTDPEFLRAKEESDAADLKFQEQILRDMGLPVNETTLKQIAYVMLWN